MQLALGPQITDLLAKEPGDGADDDREIQLPVPDPNLASLLKTVQHLGKEGMDACGLLGGGGDEQRRRTLPVKYSRGFFSGSGRDMGCYAPSRGSLGPVYSPSLAAPPLGVVDWQHPVVS